MFSRVWLAAAVRELRQRSFSDRRGRGRGRDGVCGGARMPRRLLAVFVFGLMTAALPAAAKPSGITGVYLTTRYPDLTVRGGEATTIDLELRDFHLPPQLFVLSVPQVARGWKATVLGGGQPVGSVMVMPDGEQELQLRLEPPAGAGPGDCRLPLRSVGNCRPSSSSAPSFRHCAGLRPPPTSSGSRWPMTAAATR